MSNRKKTEQTFYLFIDILIIYLFIYYYYILLRLIPILHVIHVLVSHRETYSGGLHQASQEQVQCRVDIIMLHLPYPLPLSLLFLYSNS